MKKFCYLLALCVLPLLMQGCDNEKIKEKTIIETPLNSFTRAGSVARGAEPFRIVQAQGELGGQTLTDLRTESVEKSSLNIYAVEYNTIGVVAVATWGDRTLRVVLLNVPLAGQAGDVTADAQVLADVGYDGGVLTRTEAEVKGSIKSQWNEKRTKIEKLDCSVEILTQLDGKPLRLLISGVE